MPGEPNFEFQEPAAVAEGSNEVDHPAEHVQGIPGQFEDEEERRLDSSEDDPAEPVAEETAGDELPPKKPRFRSPPRAGSSSIPTPALKRRSANRSSPAARPSALPTRSARS